MSHSPATRKISSRLERLFYTALMCGRFTYLAPEELADLAKALEQGVEPARLSPTKMRAQARPRSHVQALVPDGSRIEIADFTWGFLPTASTDVVFNTRLESALSGVQLWQRPLRDGRCIIPVAKFFEPHHSETAVSHKTGRPIKQQYEFANPDGLPLLLASVHDGTSVSILTTKPNAVVRPIHARMPLVLRIDEVAQWLGGNYSQLADRSLVPLVAAPEHPASPHALQLSLF